MEEKDVFTGKTYEEALNNALLTLALSKDDVQITVIEEGKKKLFGSTKWKIKVEEKQSDAQRAASFIDGLMSILGIDAKGEVVSEDESIKIEIKTTTGARVIGKRGDVLDAVQCLAGAVANIGREDYIKVVVDCENYRAQREETLVALAHKVEKKAVETGKKIILEPMNPYERRIIHSALVESKDVKTSSEGREPSRYVVVIPNNANPADRGLRYGEKRENRGRRNGGRGDRRERGAHGGRNRDDRRGRGDRRDRGASAGGAKRGKKEIYFGAFLGNSGAGKAAEEETEEQKHE